MVFWSIAIVVTALACAALYYAAAGRTVNAAPAGAAETNAHFRELLEGIETDLAAGKIGAAEATAARGELARELLRQEAEVGASPVGSIGTGMVFSGLAAVAVIAFGLYVALGSPSLPSLPLDQRPERQGITLEDAIAQVEARLVADPTDLRGWSVLAPAYLELGRFDDAERAYRAVLALAGPSAETETDLAEALIIRNNGAAPDEALALLESAAGRDPTHQRSRFYLAAELSRRGDYPASVAVWEELIATAGGAEPWLAAARQGLDLARNNGVAPARDVAGEQAMILGMVEGLNQRLLASGGSVAEWMQLVRAYIVLEDKDAAQAAYDRAVAAYPQAFDRGELDTIALGAGLTLNGANP